MATKELLPREALAALGEEQLFHINRLSEMGLSVAAFVHEAGQPLTAIKASLQLARAEALGSPEMLFLIDRAAAQADRAEKLFNSMREYLRPAPTRQELVDLTELVPHVVQPLGSGTSARGVNVELVCPAGDLEVIGDPLQVEQVIHNLINNAKDAVAEAGGGTVLVALEETQDDKILLFVADDGIGVPLPIQEKIFEPFFTTKKPGEGTGLGLYVVKRTLESMGAKLDFLTGNSFQDLPLAAMSTVVRVEFPGAARATTVPSLPEPTPNAQPHVLVVDDEPAIATLLAKGLTMAGLKVTTAFSGEQAVAALETERFDALLTDQNLPGLSGLDIARLARSFNPRMPVVIITAFPSEDAVRNAASLGVAEYITKPLDLEHTCHRLKQLLEQSKIPSPPPPRGNTPLTWQDVPVVLVDPDDNRRATLTLILAELKVTVVAFATPGRASAHLQQKPMSLVAAPPEVLTEHSDWFCKPPAGMGALGAVVLMDKGGVDKAITAIQLGARGMLTPPFERSMVEDEIKRAVERLLEEKLGVTTGG